MADPGGTAITQGTKSPMTANDGSCDQFSRTGWLQPAWGGLSGNDADLQLLAGLSPWTRPRPSRSH